MTKFLPVFTHPLDLQYNTRLDIFDVIKTWSTARYNLELTVKNSQNAALMDSIAIRLILPESFSFKFIDKFSMQKLFLKRSFYVI